MALASAMLLAPHFTAKELGADQPEAAPTVIANLALTAAWLETLRTELGVPLRVTNGFRTWARNAEVGGAPTSDHPTGLAADVVPVGITQLEAYRRIQAAIAAGRLPAWDQIIFYPAEGHIHIGLGEQRRRQVLIKLAEGSYAAMTAAMAAQLRGFV